MVRLLSYNIATNYRNVLYTHRIGYGPFPEPQEFPGRHDRSVGRTDLVPVLGELVHHPHAHQSHGGDQGQSDEVHVRLDDDAHDQHQESDQREPHGFTGGPDGIETE